MGGKNIYNKERGNKTLTLPEEVIIKNKLKAHTLERSWLLCKITQ